MKLIQWLIRLYPKLWRKRYQEEFIAMLEQYEKNRLVDILDIIIGAIDAHIQSKLQHKKRIQPSSVKRGVDGVINEDNLDKAFAQKTFEEAITNHQLPIVFHDVKYAPSFKDQQSTLTFYFFSDERVDLLPLGKYIASIYDQRIQFTQVGKLKYKDNARNYI